MADEHYLPEDVPTVFRGGSSLIAKPQEVKIDKATGLLKTTHGVSVDADANEVEKFGGAFRVVAIPKKLTIVQRGRRESHYEIVPAERMPFDDYQDLLNQIELESVVEEQQS